MPAIDPLSVIADRIVGKPYLEIDIDRRAIAQYGIDLQQVQDVIEIAIGGKRITTTVQGRERYPVRVRYMRELRDHIEAIGGVLVTAPDGTQIPLVQLADIRYVPGPQVIKSEDTFLVGYVLFDKKPGYAETDVVEAARDLPVGPDRHRRAGPAAGGQFRLHRQLREPGARRQKADRDPAAGPFDHLHHPLPPVPVRFHQPAGFFGVAVAWAGGFIMIWLYGQPWFLDFSIFGTSMRDLFQVHPINLSVAVWVGFLALFGIASDDGVVMATYLNNTVSKSARRHGGGRAPGGGRRQPAAGAALPHDHGHDPAGPDPGADLHRPRVGHHGAHGHPDLRRHGLRDRDHAGGAGALLPDPGAPAAAASGRYCEKNSTGYGMTATWFGNIVPNPSDRRSATRQGFDSFCNNNNILPIIYKLKPIGILPALLTVILS